MSENENIVVEPKTRSDPAFEIHAIDEDRGSVLVEIQKGILGSMANQLKNTNNQRKGASIIRKLGFELARAGNILYETDEQDHEGTVCEAETQ